MDRKKSQKSGFPWMFLKCEGYPLPRGENGTCSRRGEGGRHRGINGEGSRPSRDGLRHFNRSQVFRDCGFDRAGVASAEGVADGFQLPDEIRHIAAGIGAARRGAEVCAAAERARVVDQAP